MNSTTEEAEDSVSVMVLSWRGGIDPVFRTLFHHKPRFELAPIAPPPEERWLRLFERLSPIYKWTPGELRKVQSCPRRREALATNRPTRWATRGAPGMSSYAACFISGNVSRYFSFGVRRSRLL